MANAEQELGKMVRGFRVCDLHSLLSYAGRNKLGKKRELQYRAMELIKLRLSAIDMKIRELHHLRTGGHARVPAVETSEMYGGPPLPGPAGYNIRSNNHQRPGSRVGGNPNINKNAMAPTFIENSYDSQYRNPDVKFRELPFYDVLAELVPPTSLVKFSDSCYKENEHVFYFTPQQVRELQTSNDVTVQIRMCVSDASCEQDDEIPGSMCLKVNYIMANIPPLLPTPKAGVDVKRAKKPIDITAMIKKAAGEANVINISWASVAEKEYVVGCFLVRKINSTLLIRKLKAKGVRNPDHTTSTIKEKLLQDRNDFEVASTSLSGSLLCPLGKNKMQLPTRALTCTHLQCFDGNLYIQMNEKRPKWICPVCDKHAYYNSLVIDGLFVDIISKAPNECTEVQFHEDGSWTPVLPVKKSEISEASIDSTPKAIAPKAPTEKPKLKKPVELISLDSDSDTEDSWSMVLPPKKKLFKPSKSPTSLSPVLLDSPEEPPQKAEITVKPFNPFLPSTSKMDLPCPPKHLPAIPDRSSLPPLPESLDIDSSDVDCILGDIPLPSYIHPEGQGYENVTPAHSPEVPAPKSAFPESGGEEEILPSRHFTNFDLFSLIQPNQETNFNFPPAATDGSASPDIINID